MANVQKADGAKLRDWLQPFCWLDSDRPFRVPDKLVKRVCSDPTKLKRPITHMVPENRALAIRFDRCYSLPDSFYINGLETRNTTADNQLGLVLIAVLPKRSIMVRFSLDSVPEGFVGSTSDDGFQKVYSSKGKNDRFTKTMKTFCNTLLGGNLKSWPSATTQEAHLVLFRPAQGGAKEFGPNFADINKDIASMRGNIKLSLQKHFGQDMPRFAEHTYKVSMAAPKWSLCVFGKPGYLMPRILGNDSQGDFNIRHETLGLEYRTKYTPGEHGRGKANTKK
ncbi:uncharacterized protein TRUGW13939_00972 [Talaromyces rugulosus]|uniref:Uncharacterized protein n=1 Tax=Talaromyces rugulosus TaxID=121627 RepID=A0A7H8QJR7_TALRU|nr:uncharacterized protein TRUGW13939_00972 [Talaromyces rugulosus]QKX53892.1 hypothetical protein TRUGW13939_00972 [Talaromyces rugulosus]